MFLHLVAERQGVPCPPKSLARFSPALTFATSLSHGFFRSVSVLSVVKNLSSKGDPKMTEPRNPEFCQFAFSDNRQCRMLRHKNHASLCLFHAHAEHQLLESHRLGAEMAATFTGDFLTAADINHVMGKVFTALAQNRIPQRTAATLAYLGQVMLLSLPMAKNETKFVYSYEAWMDFINNGIRLSNSRPPSPAIPPGAAVTE